MFTPAMLGKSIPHADPRGPGLFPPQLLSRHLMCHAGPAASAQHSSRIFQNASVNGVY